MHRHLFHTMPDDTEMKIMLLITIVEIFHYYRLITKNNIQLKCFKRNLPVNLSIHCRTRTGRNPWYELACVASMISCKRGGCLCKTIRKNERLVIIRLTLSSARDELLMLMSSKLMLLYPSKDEFIHSSTIAIFNILSMLDRERSIPQLILQSIHHREHYLLLV